MQSVWPNVHRSPDLACLRASLQVNAVLFEPASEHLVDHGSWYVHGLA